MNKPPDPLIVVLRSPLLVPDLQRSLPDPVIPSLHLQLQFLRSPILAFALLPTNLAQSTAWILLLFFASSSVSPSSPSRHSRIHRVWLHPLVQLRLSPPFGRSTVLPSPASYDVLADAVSHRNRGSCFYSDQSSIEGHLCTVRHLFRLLGFRSEYQPDARVQSTTCRFSSHLCLAMILGYYSAVSVKLGASVWYVVHRFVRSFFARLRYVLISPPLF